MQKRVLVTGGTGTLGHPTVQELLRRGAAVRILSRHPRPADAATATEWAQADLLSGEGLGAAFAGVDVLLHTATNATNPLQDLDMTRQVVTAAQQAGVGHALYVSIVGIDTLGYYDYYRVKLAGEQLFARSGLPHSVQRATQFHDLVHFILSTLGRAPVLVLPRGATVQPVDPAAVAVRLAEAALGAPAGRLPDIAGPEIRTLRELAAEWLRSTGQRKPMLEAPLPLPAFRIFASGQLVAPHAERLGQTFESWLKQHPEGGNQYRLS